MKATKHIRQEKNFGAKNGRLLISSLLVTIAWAILPSLVRADGQTATPPLTAGQSAPAPASSRYGLFNWLDHNSGYGQGVFPEPFLVDDSDLEVNEARLDWVHTQAHQERDDVVTMEVEKGFGPLTLEIEVPYEVDNALNPRRTTDGFDNIDLGARVPVWQFVSSDKFFDTTFGVGIEVGIPTYSSVSKDTEVVPKVFNDLKVGDHVTLQSIIGYSKLSGSGDDGGLENFEYGFVLGYTIPHEQLAIPHVLQLIPVFELDGATQLNHGAGHDSLMGNAALRFNLKAIGSLQPRLGVGYVFPIDRGAHEDMQWGVITSLVFEY